MADSKAKWQQISDQMTRPGFPASGLPSLFPQLSPVAAAMLAQRMAVARPGPYRTALSPVQEMLFQDWVKRNKVPFDDSPTSDYDMRGFYQAAQAGDPNARTSRSDYDNRIHFTDTYKTPYHATFSNESQYATPDAPKWVGDRLVDKAGKVVADERTQQTRSQDQFLGDMRGYK